MLARADIVYNRRAVRSRGALQHTGDEALYLPLWKAVVFMNLQNNIDSV